MDRLPATGVLFCFLVKLPSNLHHTRCVKCSPWESCRFSRNICEAFEEIPSEVASLLFGEFVNSKATIFQFTKLKIT